MEASVTLASALKPSPYSRYKDGPAKEEFPMFESLKLTIERTLPYWNDVIVPQVRNNGISITFGIDGNKGGGVPTSYSNKEDPSNYTK